MATGFQFDLGPVKELLAGIGVKARNLRSVMLGPITDDIREMFRKRFVTRGVFGGTEWVPLAESTIYRKLISGQGYNHPLRRTDELFRSLTERGAPHGYARMTDASTLEVGTTHRAAALHQHGTINMPERPIVPDNVDTLSTHADGWAQLIEEHILEGAVT